MIHYGTLILDGESERPGGIKSGASGDLAIALFMHLKLRPTYYLPTYCYELATSMASRITEYPQFYLKRQDDDINRSVPVSCTICEK